MRRLAAVIGEDIVLTWKLLSKGCRIGYEATALCFTNAPTGLRGFWRQRQRWARGMIEGLKRYGSLAWQGTLTGFFVGVDFVIPVIDLFYSIVFLPGIILALTGRYYIAGPMALLVIPIAFLIVVLMMHKQKQVFQELNLKVRRNGLGFFLFMIFYQPLMSPVCLTGYLKEIAERENDGRRFCSQRIVDVWHGRSIPGARGAGRARSSETSMLRRKKCGRLPMPMNRRWFSDGRSSRQMNAFGWQSFFPGTIASSPRFVS